MFKKIVSVVLMACFLFSGIVMALPGTASAAAANTAVGIVNFGLLVDQHPDTAKANEALRAEAEQAKKEYDTKAPSLNDQDKKALDLQLGKRMEQKRRELLGAVLDKVTAAVKAVADAQGFTLILDKGAVVYGGPDITDEVLKKITGK